MRRPTACVKCRSDKRSCVKDTSQLGCRHCVKKKTPCSLTRGVSSVALTGFKRGLPQEEYLVGGLFEELGEDAIYGMVRLYLELLHDRPHSLFHIASLWDSIKQRVISNKLLLALCALGSRLSKRTEVREKGQELLTRLQAALGSAMAAETLEDVQTYILLANIYAADLEPAKEAFCFGVATRTARRLNLDHTDTNRGLIQQEIQCRVWWTLVMADSWCSTGLGIPLQLDMTKNSDIRLPCDEYTFQQWSPQHDSRNMPPILTEGLWAQMIRLVYIMKQVNDLNLLVANERLGLGDADYQTSVLAIQLEVWQSTIPEHMQEDEANLDSHRSHGLGGPFIALHLGYHHYCTLLFFRYLDENVGHSTDVQQSYSQSCRWHATCFTRLLKLSRVKSHCEAIYATVGHMAVVSSAVLLHSLLTGGLDELTLARQDLMSNFESLLELKQYWPCLDRTINRLLIFQNTCLKKNSSDTHRVDGWMVKFLTEHSLPLGERDMSVDIETTLNQGHSKDSLNPQNAQHAQEHFTHQALSKLWNLG